MLDVTEKHLMLRGGDGGKGDVGDRGEDGGTRRGGEERAEEGEERAGDISSVWEKRVNGKGVRKGERWIGHANVR